MVALASPAAHSAPRRALRPQDKRPGQRSFENIHLSLSSGTAGHERRRRRLWRARSPRVGPEDGLWPRRRSRAPSGSPAGGSSVLCRQPAPPSGACADGTGDRRASGDCEHAHPTRLSIADKHARSDSAKPSFANPPIAPGSHVCIGLSFCIERSCTRDPGGRAALLSVARAAI